MNIYVEVAIAILAVLISSLLIFRGQRRVWRYRVSYFTHVGNGEILVALDHPVSAKDRNRIQKRIAETIGVDYGLFVIWHNL